MEDFIYNEEVGTEEEIFIPATDEESLEDDKEDVVDNSTDNCPNCTDPGAFPENPDVVPEEPQSGDVAAEDPGLFMFFPPYLETDRNEDGVVDAIVMMEDTNGDGAMDRSTIYLDDDYNGTYETTIIRVDKDGDGILETTNKETDTDGDGKVDEWYEGVDINGDGKDDIAKIQYDTDQNGVVDTFAYYIDENGDGKDEFVSKGMDHNDDGQFDSQRIYEDINGNGIMDTVTEIYDSDGDGKMDVAEIHNDYDEDGRDDYTQMCKYDPETGSVIPLNDPPMYGKAIAAGTFYWELGQFEPGPDYPNGITGDPSSSMEHWEDQGDTNRCALYSQKFIVEEFTGKDINIDEFATVAKNNGWFTEDGTTFLNMNKMLNYYGIENEMSFHNDIDDIENCLSKGGRVIVSIDSDEIWKGEGDDMFVPTSSADHAVEVIGIDYSDPEHPMVILNDSGNPYGRGEMVPLDVFMDAWEDGECQMIECYPNKQVA